MPFSMLISLLPLLDFNLLRKLGHIELLENIFSVYFDNADLDLIVHLLSASGPKGKVMLLWRHIAEASVADDLW